MYFGCGGAYGNEDICVSERTKDSWDQPARIHEVSLSGAKKGQPMVTADGQELWFTSPSRLGYTGPAVFRSIRNPDGTWGEPEEIVSNFAGEPTLDPEGNLYFGHHYFSADVRMIEADIYVAYRRAPLQACGTVPAGTPAPLFSLLLPLVPLCGVFPAAKRIARRMAGNEQNG